MSMGVHQDRGGQWSFTIGVVEKWVVATGALILLSGGYWFATSVTTRLDAQADVANKMTTQLAVANTQLTTLSVLMADIPAMSRKIAELEVRVTRHDEDLRELRGRQ